MAQMFGGMMYTSSIAKRVAVIFAAISISVLCAASFTLATVQPAHAAGFKPTLKQVSENRSISEPGFLNVQGAAFDTYSQTDGYSFTQAAGNGNFRLIHFTMDANGNIEQVKSVAYKKKNVGHANDATVFKKGNKKYLFVAVSGGIELSSKASNNKKAKVAMIDLAEYNKNKAKVYAVTVKAKSGVSMSTSVAKAPLSGISYAGKRKVAGKARQVFVLKSGGMLYAAYLTGKNHKFKLTIFSSAHVNKPTISYGGKKYAATFQGLTYHNGYIYLPMSGEETKALNTSFVIARVKYSTLFKNTNNGTKPVKAFKNRVTKLSDGTTLAKHIPESIFFRKLDGKDNMYVSFNRGTTAATASDNDAVLRSTQKY